MSQSQGSLHKQPLSGQLYGPYGSPYGMRDPGHPDGSGHPEHSGLPEYGGLPEREGPYGFPAQRPQGTPPYGTPAPQDGAPQDRAPQHAAPAAGVAQTGGRAAARRAAQAHQAQAQAQARRGSARGGARGETANRLVPQALVIACLAGGTTAFVAHDKEIELNVDGSPRTLHTFADDVGELLEDEGLRAGPHDALSPAPQEGLSNGDEVELRYGRPLALTLDGQQSRLWTTARTVDEALRELGVRPEGAYLSMPRTHALSRNGTVLEVRTERSVTFVADGREHTVRTNAATVEQAVQDAGIVLKGYDTTSVAPDSFPRDGQTINIMRITGSQKVRDEPVRFDTVRREDPELSEGTEVVVRQGRQGVKRVTYQLRTVNGVKRKPKQVGAEVVDRPQARIVKVGTKKLPDSVAGADGLNWQGLAQCESGGRPDSVDASGTYGGLYQFDTSTWQSLGGSGSPQEAPAEEQTSRAKKLYVDRGSSPWPVCGRKLTQ